MSDLENMLAEMGGFILFTGAAELERYLIAVVVALLVIFVWRRWGPRIGKINASYAKPKQMLREFLNSFISIIFLQVAWLLVAISLGGVTTNVVPPFGGYLYFLNFVCILLAHDAYFYWTHRFMHWRPVYKVFHLEHHKSVHPTPWTAYSFAIPEAIVQGMFLPLYVWLVPTSTPIVLGFLAIEIIHNVTIHSGMEPFPKLLVTNRVTGWLAGATHHDMHHRFARSNYGLYFRIWDRLLGTEDPQFVAVYERIRSGQNDGDSYRVIDRSMKTGAPDSGDTKATGEGQGSRLRPELGIDGKER